MYDGLLLLIVSIQLNKKKTTKGTLMNVFYILKGVLPFNIVNS